MIRRIAHIDMDAFFASVEQVRDPALQGKALIIGGEKTDLRGVVSTASYEARKFGVHSAMPLSEAKRLCPHGIFMRGNFEQYREASLNVRRVLETVTPMVEFASIDEAYMDVTGSQKIFGGDDAIGRYIKDEIRAATQLPCTLAITPNKLVSKIASDEAKPDGYIRIDSGQEAEFLAPLPLAKLPGVGPCTRASLESLGIRTIGGLAAAPLDKLLRAFGASGYDLQRRARGESSAGVVPLRRPKSISRETTFETDRRDWGAIERTIVYLAERAAQNLRQNRMEARCITLKVRYTGFETATFSHTLSEPTCLDGEIIRALNALVPKGKARRESVRLVGVALTSLSQNQHQISLFDREDAEKWERVLGSVDELRERHGFECIRSAKSMGARHRATLSTPPSDDLPLDGA